MRVSSQQGQGFSPRPLICAPMFSATLLPSPEPEPEKSGNMVLSGGLFSENLAEAVTARCLPLHSRLAGLRAARRGKARKEKNGSAK